MKKYVLVVLLLIVVALGGILFFYDFSDSDSNSDSNSDYSAEKSKLNTNTNTNIDSNTDTNSESNISNDTLNNNSANTTKAPVETEIASYSTKIKNKRDLNRQGNITITCTALNNTVVAPGATFSFCNTVGQSTEERGYKEANVIVQGVETKGLGGGNCQVSSTLYNAILAAPNEVEVVERHPHSAPVPYIEEGKDAAISYGSHDFKFKNNTDSTIKIVAENTTDSITIKLIKIT